MNYRHHKINTQDNLVSSSLAYYLGAESNAIVDASEVSQIVNNIDSYKEYAYLQSNYFTENKDYIKDLDN